MFSNHQTSKSKLAGGCTEKTMNTTGFASNPSFGHLLARVFREWNWQFGLEKSWFWSGKLPLDVSQGLVPIFLQKHQAHTLQQKYRWVKCWVAVILPEQIFVGIFVAPSFPWLVCFNGVMGALNSRKINGFSWGYFIPHSDRRTLPRSALRPKPVSAGGPLSFFMAIRRFSRGVKQHGVFLACCGNLHVMVKLRRGCGLGWIDDDKDLFQWNTGYMLRNISKRLRFRVASWPTRWGNYLQDGMIPWICLRCFFYFVPW